MHVYGYAWMWHLAPSSELVDSSEAKGVVASRIDIVVAKQCSHLTQTGIGLLPPPLRATVSGL